MNRMEWFLFRKLLIQRIFTCTFQRMFVFFLLTKFKNIFRKLFLDFFPETFPTTKHLILNTLTKRFLLAKRICSPIITCCCCFDLPFSFLPYWSNNKPFCHWFQMDRAFHFIGFVHFCLDLFNFFSIQIKFVMGKNFYLIFAKLQLV